MSDEPLEENWIVVHRQAINITRRYPSQKAAEDSAKFLAQLNNASYAILQHVKTVSE